MKAAAAVGRDPDTIARQLVEGLAGAAGGLGILYATDVLAPHYPAIIARLIRQTGVRHWAGTVGMGIIAGSEEVFERPAAAALVLDIATADACPFGPAATAPLAAAQGWIASRRPSLGLVHADPSTPRLAGMLEEMGEASGAFLVGGLASGRGSLPQAGAGIGEGGVSGVLFAPEVAVSTGLTQGCVGVGPYHTVTAADRNMVLELDGEPALKVLSADLERAGQAAGGSLHVAFPVEGSDTGDFTVRNLIGGDRDTGAVAIGDLVAAGDRLMLVRRDAEAAGQDLGRLAGRLARHLGNRPPRAGIYVSCLARGPNLFGAGDHEVAAIRATLGEFPLVGFFANGEISRGRLYGYTGVLTLFP